MKKQKQTGLEYILDEEQQQTIDTFATESLQHQQEIENTIAHTGGLLLPPELPARQIPAVNEPPENMSRKERNKRQKERQKQQQAAHETAVIREQQERDERPDDEQVLREMAEAALLTDAPALLTFNFEEPNLFSLEAFAANRQKLNAISTSVARMDQVLNRNPDTVILERLTDEQRMKLTLICRMREPLERLTNALSACTRQQTQETRTAYETALTGFQTITGEYRALQAQLIGVRLAARIQSELPGVLETAAKERDSELKAHPEYTWMGETAYMKEHREVLQRVQNMREDKSKLRPQSRELSERLFVEMAKLANAAGQLDLRRKAMAKGFRAMRRDNPNDPDLALSGAVLAEYQRKIETLDRRMSLMENGLSYLHRNQVLGAGAAEILRQDFGFDCQADKQTVIENAKVYGDIYNQKSTIFMELLDQVDWSRYPGMTKDVFNTDTLGDRGRMLMTIGDLDASIRALDLIIRVVNARRTSRELPPDLYEEVKALVRANMEGILNLDVDAIVHADEDQMMARQRELVDLGIPNMMLSDLGKLQVQGGDKSMKDEILEEKYYLDMRPYIPEDESQRERVLDGYKAFVQEFSSRTLILNGAFAHARGLAMSRANQMGLFDPEQMLVRGENSQDKTRYDLRSPEKTGEQTKIEREAAIQKILVSMGRRFMDENSVRIPEKSLIESPRALLAMRKSDVLFKERARQNRHKEAQKPYETLRSHPVNEGEGSPVSVEMSKRAAVLMVKHYKPAGQSVAMKEAIFRAFGSFDDYPAVQNMSEETYAQMLLDLSAHYALTDTSTEEEIQTAREGNLRGFATMREVLRTHYDYLFRKYGTTLLTLEPTEMIEHYTEIVQDCRNTQVDFNLAKNIRGFLDMESPEDQLLMNRIDYYNAMGAFLSVVTSISHQPLTADETLAFVRQFIQKSSGNLAGSLGENPTTQVRWDVPYDHA
jgi:hypothetical protein